MILLYLWIALVIAGGVRGTMTLVERHRELSALRASGRNGPSLVVAREHRFTEWVRMAGYAIATAITAAAFVDTALHWIDDALVAFLALFVVNTYGTAYYRIRLDEANDAASRREGKS